MGRLVWRCFEGDVFGVGKGRRGKGLVLDCTVLYNEYVEVAAVGEDCGAVL